MAKYTEQAKIEAYLQRSLNDQESAILDDTIEVVSHVISDYTHREWRGLDEEVDEYTEDNEERFYDGEGKNELFIDELTSVESIETLDSEGNVVETLDETDYILYPLNASAFDSIYLVNGFWPLGHRKIKIVGDFGSGEAPNEVVAVASGLVSEYILRASQTGDFTKESIEGYAYELATAAERAGKIKTLMKDLDGFRKVLL